MKTLLCRDALIALTLGAAYTSASAQPPVEVQGTISIEAHSRTFKACGYDKDPVALWPPSAVDKLIAEAKQNGMYNRMYGASQDYIYAKLSLTYVSNPTVKQHCIGNLHHVFKCAQVESNFMLYKSRSSADSCDFK